MKVKDILKSGSIWIPGEDYDRLNPMVSVLLPTFRRAESGLFESAVRSVLNQTLKNIELIIIDDASTDGTYDLIKYFMKVDGRVSCIRHSYNVGLPAISEYEGYVRARGDYIAYIFDDNEWQLDYLDKTVCYMERCKIKASFGIVRSYYGEGLQEYIELGNPNYEIISLCDLNASNFIANGGVILHRDVVETVGLYDPHLSLKRVCDWDLWRRIMVEFRFEGTGIYASNENGVKLKDSLGNTVRQNGWCCAEQMSKNRNTDLRPQNYLEYDVFNFSKESTELFIDYTLYFAEQCAQKIWFDADDASLKFLKEKDKTYCKVKRIVVFTNSLDASTTLSFERLARGNPDIVFRFVKDKSISLNEIVYADACICIRNQLVPQLYIKICKELNIPCYFYIDDNYLELQEDYRKNADIKQLASTIRHNILKKYEGIFLSTKPLLDYFKEKKLHDNLILLEPVIDHKNIFRRNKSYNEKKVIIAFMGGGFRAKVFQTIVLPALEMLSKISKIVLYCPQGAITTTIPQFINANLRIEEIPKTISLDLALFRYGEKKPDILIHCGPDIKNNRYKTENSLINAVQLGAVLVASNEFPYKGENNEKPRFLLAENSEHDWYEILRQLIEAPNLREEIYQNSLDYCAEKYSIDKARKIINNELSHIDAVCYPEIIRRYEDMYVDLYFNKNRFSNTITDANPLISRSLLEVPLCLSKLIPKKTSYRIRCKVSNLSEMGLCFASYGVCKGFLILRIFEGISQLREVILRLEDLEMNDWTYFQFEPIADSQDKIYSIILSLDYEPGSSLVGVFEDATRRTFIYKVMNKLGHHIMGMDALFVDCRS